MLSRKDVVATGGDPSGGFFSTYTDICKLLTRIDDLPQVPGKGGYYTPSEEQLLTKLKSKIDEFNRSLHSHATSSAAQAKKKKEKDAVDALDKSMQDDVVCAKISKVLNDNAGSSILLVRNSVAGWIRQFQQGKISIGIKNLQGTNAQWTKTALQINPTAFFGNRNPFFPISVLVHEYHHLLTERAEPLYEDEFVAHWKQYVVGREAPFDDVGRAARINKFILVAYKKYINPFPPTTINLPQQARMSISKFPDNA